VIDMASISALIDFLMGLMSDEDTKRAFAGNPDQTLADKGLRDVSAQDVKDARLIMADQGACRPRPDGGGGSQPSGYHDGGFAAGGSNTAVREILHTTNTFEIDQSKHIDQNIFNIDNHRTTIVDSFNSQDKVIAIQDNDVTNNTDVDVNTGDEDDERDDDKTDDSSDSPDDSTDDGTEDGTDTPDGSGLPEPPLSEEQPDEGPADGPFPTEPEPPLSEEQPSDEPVDEDPGLDPGDGTDAFPPEPDPMPEPEPEPVADDLPVG
jgi:hypothetical protein